MVPYFPRKIASNAIITYLVALAIVSVVFFRYIMLWGYIVLGITWVVGFCCLAGAYFPHTVNIPFVEIANTTQAALASRMMRVMALLMVTMTATHAFDALRGRFLFTAVILIALLVVCIVFGILIAKRK